MRSPVLVAGLALTVASAAFAAPAKEAKKAEPKKADTAKTAAKDAKTAKPAAKAATPAELHCAVMTSSKLNVKRATEKKMFADYKGNRYYFCCAGCPEEFKSNPAKYAKSDHIPTPK